MVKYRVKYVDLQTYETIESEVLVDLADALETAGILLKSNFAVSATLVKVVLNPAAL